MKIAVLSDIHANQAALEQVLLHADKLQIERFWCLGDALGYGPDPHVPLLWLKYYVQPQDWVLGNHDAMFLGLMPDTDANGQAKDSLELNRKYLGLPENEEAFAFCRQEFCKEKTAPVEHNLEDLECFLVHSSQKDYLGERRYIYAWHEELFLPDEFAYLNQQSILSGKPCVQFYGHTHVPTLVYGRQDGDGFRMDPVFILPGEAYPLGDKLCLINPGSVGFPRDLNRLSSYAVLDTSQRTITFYRVHYDWSETAHKLKLFNYPSSLVERLMYADADSLTPDHWKEHYRKVVGKS